MVLRQRLMEQMESRMQVEDEELRDLIDMAILEAAEGAYLPLKERLCLRKELFDSFRRLDILQELVDDPTITEIMVNGTEHIFVERQGRVEELEKHFDSVGQLEDLIQQIVSRVNRTVNLASPIADARLEDGSRVHVVLAPVALNGPILTIRKFPEPITMERLIELKSISREAAAFLQKAVERGLNIFISGGTGSGKTTILNAMSGYIPQEDRVITIEDSAELQIRHVTNLVSLETRVENRDGSQEISMRDLIRASLRMRPDRIIVGEVRGGEALEMLQAMNTGHDGSLSTGHANSAKDMLEVDIRELLDPQRVGMDQRKEEMGIFTSKGYVFENALSYQDIYDGIHLPDIDGVAGGIFSLRLVGSQYPEEQGTWLELPTTDLGFQWVLNRLNERTFDDCIIAESISTVQGLSVKQTDDIETLNELARRIQEFTDDRTLCKFEAALELEQCDSLEQALHIAENLDCYSYDPQMYSMAAYTRYLFRELEINIDDPAFATFDFQGYGERQLGLLESVQTAYGMITRNEDFLIQAQQNTEQGMKMQ